MKYIRLTAIFEPHNQESVWSTAESGWLAAPIATTVKNAAATEDTFHDTSKEA